MATATALLADLAGIGRDPAGGYTRLAWDRPTLELREWFAAEAERRGLDVVEDGNGNQLAWWGSGPGALLVGSHLDSVRGGGAFDGPLGVVSAFAALDALRADGFTPARPVAIANFSDEEGARFGIACLGSRLATGVLAPERALGLRDDGGTTLADAMAAQGRDPAAVGRASWLDQVTCFVELHIEQGIGLARPRHTVSGAAALPSSSQLGNGPRHAVSRGAALPPSSQLGDGHPVGVASGIWPHGRYRVELTGEGNHAGTTAMGDRHDPMLTYAAAVMAAASAAEEADQRATFGRVAVQPGNTNAIPARVTAWLDARAETEDALERLVREVLADTRAAAAINGTRAHLVPESVSPAVAFDAALRERLARLLGAPVLATGAGHDAGILAGRLPTAMLFVRNPTGISHSPHEYATDEDVEAGVAALAKVIRELA